MKRCFTQTKLRWYSICHKDIFTDCLLQVSNGKLHPKSASELVRKNLKLSKFWENILFASFLAKYPLDYKCMAGAISQQWITRFCTCYAEPDVELLCKLSIYPEATLNDLRNVIPIVNRRYIDTSPHCKLDIPQIIEEVDEVTGKKLYSVIVYYKTTREQLEKVFSEIQQKYKKDGQKLNQQKIPRDFDCLVELIEMKKSGLYSSIKKLTEAFNDRYNFKDGYIAKSSSEISYALKKANQFHKKIK